MWQAELPSVTRLQVKTISSYFDVLHRSLTYERSQVRPSPRILTVITANPVQPSHSRKPFHRLVSLLTTGITKCLIFSTFESPAPLDGPSEGMMMEGISVYMQEESHEEGRQGMSCFSVCPNGR